MDNSPMYDDAFGVGVGAEWDVVRHRLQLYDVQQSALFVSESHALEALAHLCGHGDVVPLLQAQRRAMSAAINRVLWDEGSGIYRQVDASPKQRGFSYAISPTSFYPMLGGVPTAAQATRLVADHLTNASEFCVSSTACNGYMPSISRADPNFWDNSYWRGRAWAPLHLLVWIGLSQPMYAEIPIVASARKALAAQSHALLMGEWRRHRRVYENYNSTTGEGGDVQNANPFYHWGAALAYVAMREASGAELR
jgi:neutral trehalase